jgi:4-hydroxy-tetrahydrodipicolinate reductase
MIQIAILGACGRMSGRVLKMAVDDKNISVVLAIDAPNSKHIGADVGEVQGLGNLGIAVVSADDLESELKTKKPDFLVDFTSPEVSVKAAKVAAKNGVGIIVGTTGLSQKQILEIEKTIQENKIPGMIASNFSVCVNLFFKLAEQAAKSLDGYDIEIIEAHHRFKKDAPSGTAMTLARIMADAVGSKLDDVAVYGRHGIVGERPKGEIGIHAIRGGDIAGEHTAIFATLGERMEIKYQAHSRDAFASGCITAINWISKKDPGLYDMWDVIGLK